jgi:signal peptidase II
MASMGRAGRLGLVTLVLLACVGCDQGTKSIVRQFLSSPGTRSYLGGSVRFELTENMGAFLGLGSNLPTEVRYLVLVLITGASLFLILVFTIGNRSINWWQWIGLALIAGGGVANLIDRVLNRGAVVDFVQLGIGPLRTGVFNMADVAIVLGGALFVLGSLSAEDSSADSRT